MVKVIVKLYIGIDVVDVVFGGNGFEVDYVVCVGGLFVKFVGGEVVEEFVGDDVNCKWKVVDF